MSEDKEVNLLSNTQRQQLEQQLAGLPNRRAGVVEVLRVLQQAYGYLSDAAVEQAAMITGLSTVEIEELATFYPFIYRQPTGQHILRICDSVCCSMAGADSLFDWVLQHLGTAAGGVSADGEWTVLPSICLGLCERAPAVLVDDEAIGPVDKNILQSLLTDTGAKS